MGFEKRNGITIFSSSRTSLWIQVKFLNIIKDPSKYQSLETQPCALLWHFALFGPLFWNQSLFQQIITDFLQCGNSSFRRSTEVTVLNKTVKICIFFELIFHYLLIGSPLVNCYEISRPTQSSLFFLYVWSFHFLLLISWVYNQGSLMIGISPSPNTLVWVFFEGKKNCIYLFNTL